MNGPAFDSLSMEDALRLLKCLPGLRGLSQRLRVPLTCLSLGGLQSFLTIRFSDDESQVASDPAGSLDRQPLRDSSVGPADVSQSTENNIVDNNGGNRIFEIASLGKLYVNLLFCILIDGNGEEKAPEGLNWKSDAFELLNWYRKRHGKHEVPGLKRRITVEDVILHRNAFPLMQEFLLSFAGTFMPSEEQFLDHAASWANCEIHGKRHSYSTCNTIFAALLVQEIFGKPFGQLMDEKIFQRLGMEQTSMNPVTIRDWHGQNLVTKGHHVSANLMQVVPLQKSVERLSVLETVAFRCHSCTDDMSKFIQQLLKAHNGYSGGYITPDVAKLFFSRWHEPVTYTPAGFFGYLDSDLPGSDSLNIHSRHSSTPQSYQLGKSYIGQVFDGEEEDGDQLKKQNWVKKKGKTLYNLIRPKREVCKSGPRAEVYYKGGAVDGFTCSVYISQQYQCFVVAFSNATGPLDFTDYACQAVLQDILSLEPRVDIVQKVLENDLPTAQRHLEPREKSDENPPELTEQIKQFRGIYKHHYDFCTVEVMDDGRFVKKAENESVMQARVVNGKLRIFPGQVPFCIDRRYAFDNVEFEMVEKGDQVKLRDGKGGLYRKLHSSGTVTPTEI